MHTYYYYFLAHDIYYLRYYIGIPALLAMLCGPLFYFYTLSITTGNVKINLKSSYHLIPALPILVYLIYIAQKSGDERVNYYTSNLTTIQPEYIFLNTLAYVQIIFYLILSLVRLIKFQKQLEQDKLTKYKLDTGWFKSYLILVILLFIASFIIVTIINDYKLNIILGLIILNVQFVYIFINVLWSSHLFPSDTKGTFWAKDKYAAYTLSQSQLNTYFEKALNFLKQEKQYTNSELTINQLADNIEIPVQYLSQAINIKNGSGFFEFINQLRIEEAIRLFRSADYNNYTIEAIGYESGFGTKTSFNRAFKKYTGKTPSEFRKSV